ncbi:MAG TPA: hypothetical protein VFC21_02135 [Bryobacteraceae bacterium]|nr:hypothetical protein [Bryobacteraceae bacterium]
MSPEKEAILTESWQRTLRGISTSPGRMAYLASLRDANTGNYEHFGLSQKIGAVEVDHLLRRSHTDLFQEWLCFGLDRQRRELEDYLSELEGDKREIVFTWLSLGPFAGWVPAESRDVERTLYYADLSAALDLIRRDYGVASRDPDL